MKSIERKVRRIPDNEVDIIDPKEWRVPEATKRRGNYYSGNPEMKLKPRRLGRKKGSRNRIPLSVKKMVESALLKLGGADYLVGLSREHPDLFISLVKAIIPLQFNAAISQTTTVNPALMTRDEAAAELRARGIPVPEYLDNPKMLEVKGKHG